MKCVAIILTVLFMALMALPLPCQANFFNEHAEGWHWYHDAPVIKQKPKPPKPAVVAAPPDAIAQVDDMRHQVKLALDTLVLAPTPENAAHYIQVQNQLSARAAAVTVAWQAALLEHPELNYSLDHPTSQVGIAAEQAAHGALADKAITQFAHQSGLFFFYKSTCPYCQRFAPLIKHFASQYGITVVPITLDGRALPEFPNTRVDQGQAAQFHVTVTPALFAVNPTTGKAYPVAYGLTAESELREQLVKIITREGAV